MKLSYREVFAQEESNETVYAVTDTDFDGLTCAWLFEKFKKDIIIIPHSSRIAPKNGKYGWEWKINNADMVYFADQTPEPWKLQELLEKGINFQVIDHHGTSRDKVAAYDKENGTDLMSKCIFEQGKVVWNPKQEAEEEKTQDAALSLVWDYFTDSAPRPPAIQYLNAFDTYRWWTAKDSRELSKAWAEVFFSEGTDEQSQQLQEFIAEKDWRNYYALKEEIMVDNRKAIETLLNHYLEVKTGEDGPDLNEIDMNVDNFLEKAREDIARGKAKMDSHLSQCREAKKHATVITLDGKDILAVDKNTNDTVKSLHYSDLAGELADYSPNGAAAVYWQQDNAGAKTMKFSLRVRGTHSDDDTTETNVANIAEKYYFISRAEDGTVMKKNGGGHAQAASFFVNIDEEDREYPDQVLFSDIIATSRKPTDRDIVCRIPEEKTSSVQLSYREASLGDFGKNKRWKANLSVYDIIKRYEINPENYQNVSYKIFKRITRSADGFKFLLKDKKEKLKAIAQEFCDLKDKEFKNRKEFEAAFNMLFEKLYKFCDKNQIWVG